MDKSIRDHEDTRVLDLSDAYDAPSDDNVKIPKTAEVVASRIRSAIVRGELKPGKNLPSEADLIARFRVSRPTLREALRILEWEQLIQISRGARRGGLVRRPSHNLISRAAGLALQFQGATLADVYQARTLLEPAAARLAAETQPEVAAVALSASLNLESDAASKRDDACLQVAISGFHRSLMESCGNVTLAMLAYALSEITDRHQRLVYDKQQRKPESPAESDLRWQQIRYGIKSHARLVEFIGQADGAAAERHWQKHMMGAGRFWLKDLGETSVIEVLENL